MAKRWQQNLLILKVVKITKSLTLFLFISRLRSIITAVSSITVIWKRQLRRAWRSFPMIMYLSSIELMLRYFRVRFEQPDSLFKMYSFLKININYFIHCTISGKTCNWIFDKSMGNLLFSKFFQHDSRDLNFFNFYVVWHTIAHWFHQVNTWFWFSVLLWHLCIICLPNLL